MRIRPEVWVGVWVECKSMELMAASWCTRKWLRLYQTIRNITSGDMGIWIVVMRLGVTRLKNFRLVYLSDLLERRGENGQCDLGCLECLWMIWLMVVMLLSYSGVTSVFLVLSRIGPVLRSRYGIE